jgi:hypothetical protein
MVSKATSTQIALFLSEIEEHLREEKKLLQEMPEGESFREGFYRGVEHAERIAQYEKDFYHAADVLRRLLAPLGLNLDLEERESLGGSWEEMQEGLAAEIRSREKTLSALQHQLLGISVKRIKESFPEEILADFEESLEQSLQSLLR